jgi:hypothetical protein
MMNDASRAQINPSISPELSVTPIWLLGRHNTLKCCNVIMSQNGDITPLATEFGSVEVDFPLEAEFLSVWAHF